MGGINNETLDQSGGSVAKLLIPILPPYGDLFESHLILTITFLVFFFVFYYFAILPMNYVKDLTDKGYSGLIKKHDKGTIERIRRSRKIGKLPPVYPNGWFSVAESKDVGKGQVKYVSALGENFAVFRTSNGKSHILDAYCPHLGANMAVGGRVIGDCLECPFHKWKFNGEDGKCAEIPYAKKVPTFAKVKQWKSVEVNDNIFVWYHAENCEPTWFPNEVPEIKSGAISFRGRNEFLVNTHIQNIPENGADAAHFEGIHTSSFLHGTKFGDVNSLFSFFISHKWEASEWEPCKEVGKEHMAEFQLRHHLKLLGKCPFGPLSFSIQQLGPSIVLLRSETILGPVVFVQTILPVEPLTQKVIHRLYCTPPMALFGTSLLIAELIMLQRDIVIWNHLRYQEKPLLIKEDGPITKFRRWYNQFYSDNSTIFSFQKDSLEW